MTQAAGLAMSTSSHGSLGGTLLLPEASCQICEKLTSGYDTHCAEQFIGKNREHLGLRARRRNRPRSQIAVERQIGEGYVQRATVPLSDHFAGLVMFNFGFPGVLVDLPQTEVFLGEIVIRSLHPDPERRSRRTGQVSIVSRGGFHAPIFGRMLAKVGHSFAVAELGLDAFDPVLPDLIRQNGPQYLAHYIGGSLGEEEPKSTNRHEISISTYNNINGDDYIVVRIRLFSNYGMPTYYVVVGKLKIGIPAGWGGVGAPKRKDSWNAA